MGQKTQVDNVRFRAVVKIEIKGTRWEDDGYNHKTAIQTIDEKVIDIELSDDELNELVDRINSHLQLVKTEDDANGHEQVRGILG